MIYETPPATDRIGSASLVGLAGCTDVLASETALEAHVCDIDRGKVIEFSADDAHIADALIRRMQLSPEGGHNFRVRFRRMDAGLDMEWSDIRLVLDFEDHPPESPFIYLRGDEGTSAATINRTRAGETTISLDMGQTWEPPILDLIAVHTAGIDGFRTTELAVDLDLSLTDTGYTPTEYHGAYAFHFDVEPEEELA